MLKQLRSRHSDNYSYVVYDDDTREAVLVDPVATERVKDFLLEKKLDPRLIINTHGHGDHTQGNSFFQINMETEVFCHPLARGAVGKVDATVEDGQKIKVGSEILEVIHTPGHTDGSICLRAEDYLLSGDTLFLAGCGNPGFGGDTKKLFETIKSKLRQMEGGLRLYPGHDYAIRNLDFARDIEPGNELIKRKLQQVKVAKMDGEEPKSLLAEEKKYNPFFRFDDRRFIARLEIHESGAELPSECTGWDVFKHTRELRNKW